MSYASKQLLRTVMAVVLALTFSVATLAGALADGQDEDDPDPQTPRINRIAADFAAIDTKNGNPDRPVVLGSIPNPDRGNALRTAGVLVSVLLLAVQASED